VKPNAFELAFADLYNSINSSFDSIKQRELKNKLIRLNNPNFYAKFTRAHPMHEYGYYKQKTINPILISIRNMLKILKEDISYKEKLKALQTEFAWAYHEYQKSIGLFKVYKSTAPLN
jgi:hypothetical protein